MKNVPQSEITAADLMPNESEAAKVLNQRAEYFAKVQTEENQLSDQTAYVRFCIGESELYGIPYQHVKEVMDNAIVTKVPRLPSFIAGVINRRGALITIIDLYYLFYNQAVDHEQEENSIMIVSGDEMTVGFLTSGIQGSDAFDAEELTPPIASEGLREIDYVLGLHNGNTAIINIEAIFSDIKSMLRNQS